MEQTENHKRNKITSMNKNKIQYLKNIGHSQSSAKRKIYRLTPYIKKKVIKKSNLLL